MKELIALFCSFFRIGILTFGGGLAMLPMLEREIVQKHKWATLDEITDYFAIGQCTPGIIAVNTATFIGYKRKKIMGGIVATLGVIAPSLIIISALAGVIDAFEDNTYVQYAFEGIAVAVCALMVQALIKLIKSGVKDIFQFIVAVLAFTAAIFVSSIPIIVATGVIACVYKAIREKISNNKKQASEADKEEK